MCKTNIHPNNLSTALHKLYENVYIKLWYDAVKKRGDKKEIKKAERLVLSKVQVDDYVKTINSFIDSGVCLYNKDYWRLTVKDSICAVAGPNYARLQLLPKYYKDLKIYGDCINSRESVIGFLDY